MINPNHLDPTHPQNNTPFDDEDLANFNERMSSSGESTTNTSEEHNSEEGNFDEKHNSEEGNFDEKHNSEEGNFDEKHNSEEGNFNEKHNSEEYNFDEKHNSEEDNFDEKHNSEEGNFNEKHNSEEDNFDEKHNSEEGNFDEKHNSEEDNFDEKHNSEEDNFDEGKNGNNNTYIKDSDGVTIVQSLVVEHMEELRETKLPVHKVGDNFSKFILKLDDEILNHTVQQWKQTKILVLTVANEQVAKVALQALKGHAITQGKAWAKIDLKTSSSKDINELGGLSLLGMELFSHKTLKKDEHKKKIWYLPIDSDQEQASIFLEKVFEKGRRSQFDDAYNTLNEADALAVWVITEQEVHTYFEQMLEQATSDIDKKLHHWHLDFLPTLLHTSFSDKEDAKEMLEKIKKQCDQGLWSDDEYTFHEQINQELSKDGRRKRALMMKVWELEQKFGDRKADEILEERRKVVESLVFEANEVEKLVLYIVAQLDKIPVNDFRDLMEVLLQKQSVTLTHTQKVVVASPSPKHNNQSNTSEGETEPESAEEPTLMYKEETVEETLPALDYFEQHQGPLFHKFGLDELANPETQEYLLAFRENGRKEDLKEFFDSSEAIYSRHQFEAMLELLAHQPLIHEQMSDHFLKSLVGWWFKMVSRDPRRYGLKILETLNTHAHNKTHPNELRMQFNKVLLRLIREMLASNNKALKELMLRKFLKPLATQEESVDFYMHLLNLLTYNDEIKVLVYLKHALNSLEKLSPSKKPEIRTKAMRFLINYCKQAQDTSEALGNIYQWLPDSSYKDFKKANAARVGVVFLFEFLHEQFKNPQVWWEGRWSSFVLFQGMPAEPAQQQPILQMYVRWLFHPKLFSALHNSIGYEEFSKQLEWRYPKRLVLELIKQQRAEEKITPETRQQYLRQLPLEYVRLRQAEIFLDLLFQLWGSKPTQASSGAQQTAQAKADPQQIAQTLVKSLREKLPPPKLKQMYMRWRTLGTLGEHTDKKWLKEYYKKRKKIVKDLIDACKASTS